VPYADAEEQTSALTIFSAGLDINEYNLSIVHA
jgi:hypothetical protein